MSDLGTALIVDDNPSLADGLALALSQAGFLTRTARNGLHGYSCYFRGPSDWVITDIDMPELNGIEMMRIIRLINPTVKTIYMTGAIDKFRPSLNRDWRDLGAPLLLKPFHITQLIARMTGGDRSKPSPAPFALKDLHNCTDLPSVETITLAKK